MLKVGRVFLFQREIIGRVTETEKLRDLRFIDPVLVEIFAGDEHDRSRAVGDLRAIGDAQGRSDARIFLRDLRGIVVGQVGIAHLRQRIEPRVRVIFVGDRGEVVGRGAIFVDVDLARCGRTISGT